MAKDFKNNPALNYISITDDSGTPTPPNTRLKETERLQTGEILPANLHLLDELKTKRLNLVIQPTIYRLAQQRAKQQGVSTNVFIINAIIDALEGNKQ